MNDEIRDWVCTFGFGQKHANCYVVFRGKHDEARSQMFHWFGKQWSMLYYSKEDAGVYEYDYKELIPMEAEICKICKEKLIFCWSDTHGVGVCATCGAPHRIYHYDSGGTRIEAPPELCILDEDRKSVV